MSRQKTDHTAFASADAKLCEAFFDKLCKKSSATGGGFLRLELSAPHYAALTVFLLNQ